MSDPFAGPPPEHVAEARQWAMVRSEPWPHILTARIDALEAALPRCATCRHWEPTGPEGVCDRFGDGTDGARVQVDLPNIYGDGEPGYLVTRPDFGCLAHEARPVPTQENGDG